MTVDEIKNQPATGPEFQSKLIQALEEVYRAGDSQRPEYAVVNGRGVRLRNQAQAFQRLTTPTGLTSLFPGLRMPKQRLVGEGKGKRFK